MAKSAQRSFLVSFRQTGRGTAKLGYWATKSGGDITSDSSKVYDGGNLRPTVLTAPAEVDDITVGRPYDPIRDEPFLRNFRKRVGRIKGTLSVQPTDIDLVPVGRPLVYPDVTLIGMTEPEMDAASGDAAMFELTFAAETTA
jgi:hypothetical protein